MLCAARCLGGRDVFVICPIRNQKKTDSQTIVVRSASCSLSPPAERDASALISVREWPRWGWGASSQIPAMVGDVIEDLKLLERDREAQMSFGALGGKLQGEFKAQEDQKHRATYQALNDSEKKLQFFAARQIACRLLGSRGYLCQKWWLAMEDCMCTILVPCSLWHGIRFGCTCIQRIFCGKIILGNCCGKYLEFRQHILENKRLNFILIDGTWSNSASMFRHLKENAKLKWGDGELPCISLSMPGVSALHKLRPLPSWDPTCTAAAAIGLFAELHTVPLFNTFGLESQAEAVENGLVVLLDALTARRLRMGRSITRRERSNHIPNSQGSL